MASVLCISLTLLHSRIANVSTVPLCLALELLTLGCDVWRSAASRGRGVCAHPNKQKFEIHGELIRENMRPSTVAASARLRFFENAIPT